jgi:LuxR family maltose regulon positive regulatory protein
VYGLTAYARLKAAAGERRAGQALVDEAHQALHRCVDPGRLPELVARAEQELHRKPRRPPPLPYVDEVGDRELAVLRLMASDLTQREIADQLYISFNTVKTRTKSIFRKLRVSTRAEAVERARELGVL